ncbi:TetR/AcrR family transcriptional regulator [Brevibacterium sp.]|uniref:TetR/AcrR family transcriptional regulator n=1 Tax=Brevibacterium sp. TaxID=1701 RepID=UPI0025C6B362|nr:TetR/AcrR family transcriptional regulator [Brevibacterium sp.]
MRENGTRRRAAPHFIDRATVIAAALEAFAERGFHGASTRSIAALARTSLSNLYNYFGSKDEILEFVLESTSRELADSLETAVADAGGGPPGRLAAAVSAYVRFIVDKPQASLVGITEFRYLAGERRAAVVEQRDRSEAVFRAVISEGRAAGDFDVLDVPSATRAAVSLCNSMSAWYRPDGPHSADELVRLQVDLALGLVRSAQRAERSSPAHHRNPRRSSEAP